MELQKFQPQAGCIVALKDGLVLAVPRRSGNQWGLPGGKVEKGETPRQAAIREMVEETGVSLDPTYITEQAVHAAVDCMGTLTHTFYYHGPTINPTTGDTGQPKWIPWEELIRGPFSDYNSTVRQRVMDMLFGIPS